MQVLKTSKKKLDVDYLDTLSSMNNLAVTYKNQSRWDAAKELDVQVIKMRRKKLGADYPSTLNSINNLAVTYKNQSR